MHSILGRDNGSCILGPFRISSVKLPLFAALVIAEKRLGAESSLQKVPFVTSEPPSRPVHAVKGTDHAGNAGPKLVTESAAGINGPKLQESVRGNSMLHTTGGDTYASMH